MLDKEHKWNAERVLHLQWGTFLTVESSNQN